MKRLLHTTKFAVFVLLLLAAAGAAKAQTHEFAPVGAEWYYGINQFSIEGYTQIKSVSDTIINGVTCKKIEKRCFLFDHLDGVEKEFVKGHEYISQIGDSVMIYRFGQFYKLYDFTVEIGDTVAFPGSYSCEVDEFVVFGDSIGEAVVVGKGVSEINGNELKYYDLRKVGNSAWAFDQDFYAGYARICEKIGNISGYLFPQQQLIADYFEGGSLRCYSDDETGTISFSTPYIECDYFHAVEDNALVTSAVYPNPFKEKITVELPTEDNYTVLVYDTFGRTIIKQDVIGKTIELDFPFPQSGVFHLVIQSNSANYATNIIKL